MNKLSIGTIATMAYLFLIYTTDEKKQAIIDQLGFVLSNHTEFVIALYEKASGSKLVISYAINDYRRFTKNLSMVA